MAKHRLDQHVKDSVGKHMLLLQDRYRQQAEELKLVRGQTLDLRRLLDRQRTEAKLAAEHAKEEQRRQLKREIKRQEERSHQRLQRQCDGLLALSRKLAAQRGRFFLFTFSGVEAVRGSDCDWISPRFALAGREYLLRLVKSVPVDMDGDGGDGDDGGGIGRQLLTLSLLYLGKLSDELVALMDDKDDRRAEERKDAATAAAAGAAQAGAAAAADRSTADSSARRSERAAFDHWMWHPSHPSHDLMQRHSEENEAAAAVSALEERAASQLHGGAEPARRRQRQRESSAAERTLEATRASQRDRERERERQKEREREQHRRHESEMRRLHGRDSGSRHPRVRFDDDVDIIQVDSSFPPAPEQVDAAGDGSRADSALHWALGQFPSSSSSSSSALPAAGEREQARVRFFVYNQKADEYSPSAAAQSAASPAAAAAASLPSIVYSSTALLSFPASPASHSSFQSAFRAPHCSFAFSSFDPPPYLSLVHTEDVPIADSEGDGGRGWIDAERKTVTAAVMVDELATAAGGSGGDDLSSAVTREEYRLLTDDWCARRARELQPGMQAAGGHRLPINSSKRRRMEEMNN